MKRAIASLFLALAILVAPAQARAAEVVVFAAASLKNVLDGVASDWEATSGDRVLLSYAGTSALARQIQQGAPADIFLSASAEWMDIVAADGRVVPETRHDLLSNQLALVAAPGVAEPGDALLTVAALTPVVAAAGRPGGAGVAMAYVDAVPVGIYGKAALTTLGLWDAIEPGVVQTENVQATLTLVARGEVPYGIVYTTDAAAEPGVTLVGRFSTDLHLPIVYPAALLEGASPGAAAFFDHLRGPEARAAFEAAGFTRP